MKDFVIVDGNSYFYRAFYATRRLTTSKGFPTGAIHTFAQMFMRIRHRIKPEFMVMVFDAAKKSFRSELYPEYKTHRPPMPDELSMQIPYIKKMPPLFGIKTLELEGFEADDIIATMATRAFKSGFRVLILTKDKDIAQVVNSESPNAPGIFIYDDEKHSFNGIAEIKAKYGIPPIQIPDFLALTGDTSDNVPGVKGIGEKRALALLSKFESIEEIYANLARVENEKVRAMLEASKDMAFLSKKLVTLVTELPLDIKPEDCKILESNNSELSKLFSELEFTKLADEFGIRISSPVMEIESQQTEGVLQFSDDVQTRIIWSSDDLNTFFQSLSQVVACFPLAETEVIGAAFCDDKGRTAYVPLAHSYLGVPQQIDKKDFCAAMRALESRKLVCFDAKCLLRLLLKNGFDYAGTVDDAFLAAVVLNPDESLFSLERIASAAGLRVPRNPDILKGSGRSKHALCESEVSAAAEVAIENARSLLPAYRHLRAGIETNQMAELYDTIERPLMKIVAAMETNGIKIDSAVLKKFSAFLDSKMKKIESECHDLAGLKFNVNSPKQLQEILFDRLKLPVIKETKTGRSTDEETLAELSQHHKLPSLVVEYRSCAKLKNTYADALPAAVNPSTGRIHCTIGQIGTATGRLITSNPNLQNIPARGEEGKLVRSAFIAEDGNVLVVADYSQVELRILAHFSEDPFLINAFKSDADIHLQTACEVFRLTPDKVTEDVRRRAKTINFGLMYGQSAYGLASQLGIHPREAESYIKLYFERFAGVKKYYDSTKAFALKNGYVKTLFGRRRFTFGIDSRNSAIRSQAERIAINMPIQGTAADIIKIAMIRLAEKFAAEFPDARILLQVHDELVIECPEKISGEVSKLVSQTMEGAANLRVPLKVDCGVGRNWAEAKK